MEFEIDFPAGGPADVVMSVSGVPTLAELELFNEALVSDPRFRAGLSRRVFSSRAEPVAWLEEQKRLEKQESGPG